MWLFPFFLPRINFGSRPILTPLPRTFFRAKINTTYSPLAMSSKMTTDIDCAFISALLLRPANRKTLKWIVQNSSTLIYIKEDDEMVRHTDIRVAFPNFVVDLLYQASFRRNSLKLKKKTNCIICVPHYHFSKVLLMVLKRDYLKFVGVRVL